MKNHDSPGQQKAQNCSTSGASFILHLHARPHRRFSQNHPKNTTRPAIKKFVKKSRFARTVENSKCDFANFAIPPISRLNVDEKYRKLRRYMSATLLREALQLEFIDLFRILCWVQDHRVFLFILDPMTASLKH